MVTRREVEKALEHAVMDPPGRHIVLALLTRCVYETATIAPKYAPTFTELERITGYSRSALTEWMKVLADAGWVRREQFPNEAKLGFAIEIGSPDAARPKRKRDEKRRFPVPPGGTGAGPTESSEPATTIDSAYREAAQPPVGGVPRGGMDRTAQRYDDVPPGGTEQLALLIQNSPTESSTTKTTARRAAKPRKPAAQTDGEPTVNQRIDRLTKIYTDEVKLSKFMAVQAIVRTAVTSGQYADDAIELAMKDLASRRDFVTTNTLRVSLEGLPVRNEQGRRNGSLGGHQPFQNPADPAAYHGEL